jgi:hypothetical protein
LRILLKSFKIFFSRLKFKNKNLYLENLSLLLKFPFLVSMFCFALIEHRHAHRIVLTFMSSARNCQFRSLFTLSPLKSIKSLALSDPVFATWCREGEEMHILTLAPIKSALIWKFCMFEVNKKTSLFFHEKNPAV